MAEPREPLALLGNGPKTAKELSTLMRVSEKTLYKHMTRLLEERKVLIYPMRRGNRFVALYSLPEHIDAAVSLSGYLPVTKMPDIHPRIQRTMELLREKLLRNPDVDEIILELGESPEDKVTRDLVYRIGPTLKWRPPTPAERAAADRERAHLLRVAGWLKKGRVSEEALKGASKREMERAREYLEKFPEEVS
ncbi:MAG: hypothetical protein QXO51_02345 [Halobacteria archaeon]